MLKKYYEDKRAEVEEFMNDESGQGMVEYGLILALIAVAAVAILGTVGSKIKDVFSGAADKLNVATEG